MISKSLRKISRALKAECPFGLGCRKQGGWWGTRPLQLLAGQLTLFEPGWADFAPYTTASPLGFKNYLRL